MLEAELETSSGEQSDGLKPSFNLKSEVEKRLMAVRSLKSDKWEEYAENIRVSLPRRDWLCPQKAVRGISKSMQFRRRLRKSVRVR